MAFFVCYRITRSLIILEAVDNHAMESRNLELFSFILERKIFPLTLSALEKLSAQNFRDFLHQLCAQIMLLVHVECKCFIEQSSTRNEGKNFLEKNLR